MPKISRPDVGARQQFRPRRSRLPQIRRAKACLGVKCFMYFSPPMLIRILTPFAVLCAFAGCGKIADGRLFGLWRSEIGEDPYTEIDELRLNPDHTFVSWMCPAELTTPQTFVYGGEWHVRGNHIEMDSRLLNKEALPEHRSFQVLPSKDDELLVKNMDDGKTFRFHRFNLPRCTTSSAQSDPVEIDRNIVGSWDVHYHTHDFKYRLAPDHTVNVLGKLSQSDKYFPLWKGGLGRLWPEPFDGSKVGCAWLARQEGALDPVQISA
jgi:hypothetical protein